MRPVLAIDIGGTKLAAAVVDPSGAMVDRRSARTPPGASELELWDALVAVIGPGGVGGGVGAGVAAGGVGGGGVAACGVGCGGPMSAGGETVSPLNIPGWRGFPLRSRLAGLLGVPVRVDNDAKALALGEGWLGAAAGVRDFIAMVVSTGVGGGIVLDGRLLDGRSGNAGHIGHVIVDPDGPPCACGARGCLEAIASGPSIERATGAPAASAPDVVRRATGVAVGRAVASVANLLDLRLAVIAGSVALGYGAAFFEAAQEEVDRLCRLDHSVGTRVVPAGLGDAGPLIGAAAVAYRALGHPILAATSAT